MIATSAPTTTTRRCVVPREAVDEALGRRFALLRFLDQLDDAGDGVVGGGRGHANAQRSLAVDRAGEHLLVAALRTACFRR